MSSPMRSRAAIVREVGGDWSVEEFELDPPRAGEVLVAMAAAGLCHSDDHIRNGFMASPTAQKSRPPTIGGHEGSGVVLEVGEAVTGLAPGDHVVTSFIAVCGHCRWCSSGMEYLCDRGAGVLTPGMPTDGTFRHHTVDGQDLGCGQGDGVLIGALLCGVRGGGDDVGAAGAQLSGSDLRPGLFVQDPWVAGGGHAAGRGDG